MNRFLRLELLVVAILMAGISAWAQDGTSGQVLEDAEKIAPEGWTNAMLNGNLAGSGVSRFAAKEYPSTESDVNIVEGAGKNGGRGIVVQSADETDVEAWAPWDSQFWIVLPEELPAGTILHVEFDYKASKDAKTTLQVHANPGAYLTWEGFNDVYFSTEWQSYSAEITVSGDMVGMRSIAFNLAEERTSVDYHFDNFGVWYQKPAPIAAWTDLIVNGDMEGESSECFYVTEQGIGGPYLAKFTDGIGVDGSRAVMVQSADDPANTWDTQFFIRLPYLLPAGTMYKVSFDYKADKYATFDTQAHEEPGGYIHWACVGSGAFCDEWQTYEQEGDISSSMSPNGNMQTIAFNLANNGEATHFIIDNVKFEVPANVLATLTKNPAVNPEPYPDNIELVDIIVNGDMESENPECFYVVEQGVGGPYLAKFTEGIGKDGSRAVMVQSADNPVNDWDSEFFVRLPYQLPAGTKYKVSFDYKADKNAEFQTQAHGEPQGYIHYECIGSGTFTTEWQTYEKEGTVSADMSKEDRLMQSIDFLLAHNKEATQFIIDNVKFEIPANVLAKLTKNPAVNPEPYPDNIEFADAAVKALCVENWDTNGDGELSFAEAAAVTDLGRVFYDNKTITSFDELQHFTGLTSIGNNAFFASTHLRSVVIPRNVTTIGSSAFGLCFNIRKIYIPKSVTSIGHLAFRACMPSSLVVADGNPVYDSRDNCNAIIRTADNYLLFGFPSTVIPGTVKTIGASAFNSSDLSTIDIPNSVETIEEDAFWDNQGLSYVSIPNSVTTIGNNAFGACYALTEITIPESVTSIGNGAFFQCTNLKSVTSLIEEPFSIDNTTFSNVNSDNEQVFTTATLHVPAGCKAKYETTDGWKNFQNIVEEVIEYGLVAYYPFNGNAYDETGHGNHGSLNGGVSLGKGVHGDDDGAYQFGGYDNPGYILVPNSQSLQFSDAATFSVYLKPTSWVSMDGWGSRVQSNGHQAFLAKEDDRYGVTYLLSGDDTKMSINMASFDNQWAGVSSGDLKGNYLNKWTHVAIVYGKGHAKLYVDGQLLCDNEASPDFTDMNTRNLYIGRFSSSWYPFNGLIDEVRIYNRALNSSEIEMLAQYSEEKPASNDDSSPIQFADEWVKYLCVDNWDTNGDGELSYGEAAAVTDLAYVFYDSYDITSFNELQYFTGLTAIHENAFYGSGITSIVIPDGVTSIGNSAFERCTYLSSIVIPDQVTAISKGLFKSCGQLSSVTIGSGVTSIDEDAFQDCGNLLSLTIPSNVTSIANGAFRGGYHLSSIEVASNNPVYGSNNCNAIIEKATRTLIVGCKNTVIPAGITAIADGAFEGCGQLYSVSIPSSVKTIGSYAFGDCSNLRTIISKIESPFAIGENVFSTIYQTATLIVPTGCLDAYRQTAAWNEFVNIEEADLNVNIEFADATVKALCVQNWDTDGDGELSYDEAAAVTDLGLVFSGHDQVTSFDELQYFTGLTSLGELAFGGCNYLASITFPASVTTIGTNAFNNCFTLESVTIPASVTSIAEYAFFSCGGLQAVISLIQDPFEIGDDVFLETPRDQGLAVLYVPAGCKAKYEATNGWKSFQNIVEMGGSDDPDEVAQKKEQLQKTIYSLMAKLQALFNELEEKPDCEEKTEAQQRAYIVGAEIDTAQKNLSTASSLDELSAVEKETNNLMAALAYLYQIIQEIPDTEAVVFVVDGITYMVISEEEKTVQVGQGNWDYRAVDKTTEGEITIPAQVEGYNVVAISDFAFEGCSRLTKINIPEGVISIGEQGFCRCSSLKSIHIPASLTSIGYVAFSSCGNVETITVAEGNTRYSSPDGCNAIIQSGYCLVRGCRNTVIPEGVTAMNNCAFNGVSGLTTITLPQSLTSVGGWAFSGCTDLQNVVLSENTSSIGYMAFNGCSSLTSITLPGQVNIIREYAFAGCNSLMNIIVKMEAPFAITDDVFQCWIDNNNLYLYDNATLYVPKGTKALYGSTDGWKNFQNIVEMDYDDMTYLLSNPQFEDGKNGWIVQAAGGGNVAVAGLPENKCFEAWNNSSFDIYQVVTGAPVGVYEIEVQGFYRYLRGDNAWNAYKDQQVDYVKPEGVPVYVYLNNNATPFKNIYSEPVPYGTLYTTNSSLLYPSNLPPCEDDMGNWYPNEMYNSAIAFNAGMYKQSAFGLIAKEGDPFRIGVKGKSNQGNDSWVIWDNFKLFYRGFKPDVVRPILETAIADVEEYLGLLMGKTEYAALTTGLANAVQGIADNDGELMFSALNMLWDVKDPARISKDIFLEQEVAADTLRLAEKLRSLANEHLSKATFNDACALLEGIKNNTLYENTETALLKNDVTAMINRLQASVTGYDKLLSAYDEIYKTDARVGDDTRAGLADEFKEIEYLADLGYQNYYDGTFTDEQAYDYTNDLLRRVEILKENIANYIVPADWAILKTAYEQNNPNGTWSKIWKFNRGKPWKDDVPGVETDDGHVVSLWLTDNNMTGAVPMDFFTLPNLHTVNLSSNHLTTLDEALPAQVTYLYLDDQTMDYVANISLKDAVTNGVAQQMPSILRYDHSSRSFTAPLTLYCSTTDNKWSMHIEVGSEGQMSITYASDAYIGANGAMFNASTWDGSTFSVCLTFEQGDGNFDGEVNVLDLQADINYIFENRSKPFNLTAADLFTDSKVTVQDIVKLVDVLMAAGGDNPTAGARNVAPARVPANVQSCLFVQNGQLMLSTDTPVAAFDIFVDQTFDFTLDEALRQMGFKCRMEQQQSGYHLIGYSLAGATLPVGETVIGTTTGRDAVVTSALLSDADAQPVSVMLNDQITTAIGHASDLRPQTSALYDLQGRRLDKVGRKGMYIKDNRKIVK